MPVLIATHFLGGKYILHPGSSQGIKISTAKYRELAGADSRASNPAWLVDAVRARWDLDIHNDTVAETVLVRPESIHGFARASYELNLFCNYDCKICYLGEKVSAGLPWEQRERLLRIIAESGVVWLQLTGGEALIDRLFPEVYSLADDLGMMISISTNGSNLSDPRILELLTTRHPYRLTVSVYGANSASYDSQTQRRGSYAKFLRGLDAAKEADLPVKLSLIVTTDSDGEVDQMKALADSYGYPYSVYSNMSPTIYGGAESLPYQSDTFAKERAVFTGCNAGFTHYAVDPLGMASICKIGREPNVPLMVEGVEGLRRLNGIGEALLTRQGGCGGCTRSEKCTTCMPLAAIYRQAQAPLTSYCQHG